MRNRRSRKADRREGADEADHRWIITYADFVTLLFGFFLMLYAATSVQVRQLQSALTQSNLQVDQIHQALALKTQQDAQSLHVNAPPPPIAGPPLDVISQQLQAGNSDLVRVTNNQDWLSIEIKSSGLFAIGSATPTPQMNDILRQILPSIASYDYKIMVEGHTDNQPILSDEFASNWELSSVRAATVARMLNELGIRKERLSAIGYSDQFPLVSNYTPEGRAQNRRVVIVMMKNALRT